MCPISCHFFTLKFTILTTSDLHNFGSRPDIHKRQTAIVLSLTALSKGPIKSLSKISFHIHFKNKATKSSKNVPSLGGNVDWVCLGCDVVVGDCIGGNFVPGEKVVVEVAVVGNVAV